MSTLKKVGPLLNVCKTESEARAWGDSLPPADRDMAKMFRADGVIVDEIKRADGVIVYGVWLGRKS